jgi:chorismate mutase
METMSVDKIDSDVFHLDKVAALLESLEETIIYRLLDRSQFAANPGIYQVVDQPMPGFSNQSFLQVRLRMQEEMDALFGRFMVPEERPYTLGLPPPRRTTPKSDNPFPAMDFATVSQTPAILASYLGLLPRLCLAGDDGHYGSSVETDVYALQAIARRVHYGALYVAESKFRSEPDRYGRMIRERDEAGILAALTRPEVEARILIRVREKLDSVQQRVNTAIRRVIAADLIMDYYRDHVIPMTKAGEVAYLLARKD